MESKIIMDKNRVPLIIRTKISLNRKKFLINNDNTLGSFMFFLQTQHIHIKKSESLYIFFNNKILNPNIKFSTLYTNYKSDDGFLYADLVIENSFG